MRKTVKIVLISILVIVVLYLGFEFWLGYKVRTTLEHEVSARTKGAVALKIDDVSVNLLGRAVKLKGIHVSGDSVLLTRHNIPFAGVNGHIEELAVKGVHWKKRDSMTRVRVRKLILRSSSMDLTGKAAGQTDKKNLHESAGGMLAGLEIKEFDLKLDDVRYKEREQQHWARTAVQNLHVRVEGIDWEASPAAGGRGLSCEAMQVSLDGVRQDLANGNLSLSVKELMLDSREGRMKVDSVSLLPMLSKEEYAKVTGQDWTRVQVANVSAEQWDFSRVMNDRLLAVGHVAIKDVQVSSYKNRQIDQPERVKKLFYEGVQQFPMAVEVGKIELPRVNVVYEELSKNGDAPGRITFNNLSGEFEGLTNVARADRAYYKLKVRGKLLDAGEFTTTVHLPVDSTNSHFLVDGEVGKMDMRVLNSMVTPLTKVAVHSGEMNHVKFQITGNALESNVETVFLYDDLVITLLKEKDGHMQKRSMLTNILNGVFVRKDNPHNGVTRTAKASTERDLYRSQFNYLWRSLFAGIMKVVEE